jgi:hypothetical protein
MTMTEKTGPEFPKQTALKRLRKEIGKHLVRGTVGNRNAIGLETVLPAGCSNILVKPDSALVILIKMFLVRS